VLELAAGERVELPADGRACEEPPHATSRSMNTGMIGRRRGTPDSSAAAGARLSDSAGAAGQGDNVSGSGHCWGAS